MGKAGKDGPCTVNTPGLDTSYGPLPPTKVLVAIDQNETDEVFRSFQRNNLHCDLVKIWDPYDETMGMNVINLKNNFEAYRKIQVSELMTTRSEGWMSGSLMVNYIQVLNNIAKEKELNIIFLSGQNV